MITIEEIEKSEEIWDKCLTYPRNYVYSIIALDFEIQIPMREYIKLWLIKGDENETLFVYNKRLKEIRDTYKETFANSQRKEIQMIILYWLNDRHKNWNSIYNCIAGKKKLCNTLTFGFWERKER
jgi:hypothetical protein